MDKIVAVVQARMASRRLPGKCLIEIEGEPIISIVLRRLSFSKYIEFTVIATTTNREDKRLARFAQKNGIRIYRGSQDDIVDRLYQAGKQFGADIVVRIWGDSPLIDPNLIDMLIEKLVSSDADYATNTRPETYPLGMNAEVYRLKTLEMIRGATQDPFYREFPIEYIFESNRFKKETLQYKSNLSHIKLGLDYKEDLQLISRIYKELITKRPFFRLEDIIEFLSKNKDLVDINKNLPRNTEYKVECSKRKQTNQGVI